MACDNICVINRVETGTNPVAFKEAKDLQNVYLTVSCI